MTTGRVARWLLILTPLLLSCSEPAPPFPSHRETMASRTAPLVSTLQAKLLASDKANDTSFGNSLSLSMDGSVALVGALRSSDGDTKENGAAEVFVRAGNTWVLQQKLLADDKESGDELGCSVSLSADGNTALLGAFDESDGASYQGAAYVFVRSGSTWSQQAKLLAKDGKPKDIFGGRVALAADGQTALISALGSSDDGKTLNGAAYVFVRNGTLWTEQGKLLASDKLSFDQFGMSVSLSADGSTALVGASDSTDSGTAWNGAAYVFVRAGDTWVQQQKLLADDKSNSNNFGIAVKLSGDGQSALIGAWGTNASDANQGGAAYVFTRSGPNWSQQAKLVATTPFVGFVFGFSLSLSTDGTVALVGDMDAAAVDAPSAGAAYLFTRAGSTWSQRAILSADDAATQAYFGYSVSLSGDGRLALVGAIGTDDDGTIDNGSAYLFALSKSAGDECSTGEQCPSGFCVDGVCCDRACEAGPCEACSVSTGASADGVCALLTGPPCDDGDACTSGDICQAGLCQAGASVKCEPGDCQQGGSCEPGTGVCLFTPRPDGTPCASGLCLEGLCAGGDGGSSGSSTHAGGQGVAGMLAQAGTTGQGGVAPAGHAGSTSSGGSGPKDLASTSSSELVGGGCSCATAGGVRSTGVGALATLVLGLAGRRRRAGSLRRVA